MMRNQKLHAVLTARTQVASGECTADEALTRLVWEMLEPLERKVLGLAVQMQSVSSPDVMERFKVSPTHASTVLKYLYDNGLLTRTPDSDVIGMRYAYTPARWIADV